MMRVLLFLTFMLLSMSGYGRTCTPVNLLDDPQSPFWKTIPIYDQGDLSTCYAFTSAQMIDYWQYKKGEEKGLTSGIWTALIHKIKRKNFHWNPNSLDYSLMQWTLSDIRKYGICPADKVARSLEHLRRGTDLDDNEVLIVFNEVWDRYHQTRKGERDRDAYNGVFGDLFRSAPERQEALQYLRRRFRHIMDYNSKKDRLEYLLENIFTECRAEDLYLPEIPKAKTCCRGWASQKKVAKNIEKSLTQDIPQPLGIGYCAKIYSQPDLANEAMRTNRILPRALRMAVNESLCSPHYSIVAGQRPVTVNGKESCEYLIRNTYAARFWTKDHPCLCRTGGNGKETITFECRHSDTNLPVDIEVLGCWLPQEQFTPVVFDLNYFPN